VGEAIDAGLSTAFHFLPIFLGSFLHFSRY
jgi:hypothetical protein